MNHRWVLLAAGGIVLAVAGLVVALPRVAHTRLAERGCTVDAVSREGLAVVATGLVCPGLAAASARWDVPRCEVRLSKASFEATDWADGLRTRREASVAWPRLVRRVRVDGLEVRAGDLVLAGDLAGSVVPLDLAGPGVSVRQEGAVILLDVERDLAGPPVAGRVRASARWDGAAGTVEGSVEADPSGLTVSWPLLASRPIEGLAARATFRGRASARLDLEGTAGLPGLEARWTVKEEDGGVLSLEAVLPDTDLAMALEPFGPAVPEAHRARVGGTVGGRVAWRSTGLPKAEIRLEGVEADGALPPGLDRGRVSWPCRTASGETTACTTGDGVPGWTPLRAVPPHVVHAVLAAEDAAFRSHRGYDPAALQEALDADLAALRVVRGGSTLTQQLAKNLFLGGEQTLARKARELVLAVELDRTLGKDRVLELYLNVVEWGPGIHGLAAACERYFLKAPSRVDPLEAAFLAALLPSPRTGYRRWYLEGRPNRERLDAILDAMVQAGWLRPDEAEVWKAAPLRLVPPPRP